MKRLLLLLAVITFFGGELAYCQIPPGNYVSFTGYCDSISFAGQPFVLYGLGQNEPATYTKGAQYTRCIYNPGSDPMDVWLGEPAAINGMISNLYVKQGQFSTGSMGGMVAIWINPKTGGVPIFTGISCGLIFNTSNVYTCNDTSHQYNVSIGDRIIAVVTPPAGQTISPVNVTIDNRPISFVSNNTITLTGYCNTVSDPGNQWVLYELGQKKTSTCTVLPGILPGAPLAATMGTAIPVPTANSLVSSSIQNLYVKQQLLGGSGFLGATVQVWVNPKSGGPPIQTPIMCTTVPAPPDPIYSCSDISHSYAAVPGDRVVVIATPLDGHSLAPITASVDFNYTPKL